MKSGCFQRDSTLFLATWPRAGSMRSGCVYERATLGRRTGGSGGSASDIWPTANVGTTGGPVGLCGGAGNRAKWNKIMAAWPSPRGEDSECYGNHPGVTDSLTGATKLWTTPNGDDVSNLTRDSGQFKSLTRDVKLWTTPQSHDQAGGNPNRVNRANGGGCANLADDVTLWRTPSAQEPGISADRLTGEQGSRMYDKETGRLAQYGITQQVEIRQTPTTNSFGSRGGDRKDEMGLDQQSRSFLPAPETPPLGETSSNDGPGLRRQSASTKLTDLAQPLNSPKDPRLLAKRLNPYFVEWLMGFPPGWTSAQPHGLIDYERWETAVAHCKYALRLLY